MVTSKGQKADPSKQGHKAVIDAEEKRQKRARLIILAYALTPAWFGLLLILAYYIGPISSLVSYLLTLLLKYLALLPFHHKAAALVHHP